MVIRHFFLVEDIRYLVYVAAAISTLIVVYSLYEGYRRWFKGYSLKEIGGSTPRSFLANIVRYGLFQYKVVRHRFPGAIHALIFIGILWLFIATILRFIDYNFVFIKNEVFFAYKLLNNIAGLMVVVGSLLAMYRRYSGLTPGLPRDWGYYLIHILLIVIVVTGFALNGMAARGYRSGFESPLYDPIGYIFFLAAGGIPSGQFEVYYRLLWVLHMILAEAAIALIPFTNLWHMIVTPINIGLARPEPPVASLRRYYDIDERIDRGEVIGIVRLSDTTWKQRLDYEACTNCFRCTNACPAVESGKILDPRLVVRGMATLMLEGKWDSVVWEDGSKVGVSPEAIWSCLTCGACVAECPVLIHHVDTIIDVRRGMISVGHEGVPENALDALYNIQQTGNPYGANPVEREKWLEGLESKLGGGVIAEPGVEYDYLFWVGCVTSYDPRIRPVAESIIKLLKRAGYRVAVIPEASCSGEPALRMGEEALFVELMVRNLEILSQYRFKKLLVNCPHCYTVFSHDYKGYRKYLESRGEYKRLVRVLDSLRVEHHTVAIERAIREGRLKPSIRVKARVTYHDPCYLGRWNGIYEEPRKALSRVGGLRIKEMPRNREKSFCCGGGGGNMFFEIKRGKRVSAIRAEEAAKTLDSIRGDGDRVVAVACPFCNTMFRGESGNYDFKVMDVAQILEMAIEERGD